MRGGLQPPGMVPMDLVAVIRHKVLTEGVPLREVSRELGLSRNTVRRYARAKSIAGPRVVRDARVAPVRDAVRVEAEALWRDRRAFTAGKQRLTAERLTELLRERGHEASARTAKASSSIPSPRSASSPPPCACSTSPARTSMRASSSSR